MKAGEVYILDGKRTPFGRFYGALRDISAPQLARYALRVLVQKYKGYPITQVILGSAVQAGLGQNPARQAALFAGLPEDTSAMTVSKVCSSGLLSVKLAVQAILLGEANFIIAGGMESMSRAPYLLNRPNKKVFNDMSFSDFLDSSAADDICSVRDALNDGLHDAYGYGMMGSIGEHCAQKFRISREAQDAYASESYLRAFHAKDDIAFRVQILGSGMPITFDEEIKEPDFKKMSLLPTAFKENGTITAANSSKLSDGAAALLLVSQTFANRRGLEPLARICAFAEYSGDPNYFPTAPAEVIQKLLQKEDLSVDDIDLFEINEAFALVPIYTMRELCIPHEKVNIWGGAIALGHPLGASGTRILLNLALALRAKGKKRGIAALCNGGGEAIAVLIEHV